MRQLKLKIEKSRIELKKIITDKNWKNLSKNEQLYILDILKRLNDIEDNIIFKYLMK